MHHHNCYIISAIAHYLDTELENNYLVKCFSNSIDEIYFEFSKFSFRCIFYKGELFFSFDNDIVGENRLFKPQFRELINDRVKEVVPHPYERSFHITFDSGLQLVIKCFGRKSNILLFIEDKVQDIFRKNIETDLDLKWSDIVRNIVPEFNKEDCASPTLFAAKYPYLPYQFYEVLSRELSNTDFKRLLTSFSNSTNLSFDNETLELSFDLNTTENNIAETITAFTSEYLKIKIFTGQKEELLLQFSTRLKEKENYLKANTAALKKLLNTRKDEEIGNIILANLHAIKEGEKKIIVNDVYHNVPIEIKLDPKLSALKNADAYFKKDKARPFIIKQLEGKINNGEKEIVQLKEKLEIADKAINNKGLKAFTKSKNTDRETTSLPYKYFKIEDYEVLVGKHAESNEKLLNYYSDKDDIWLHAKDVGGSHVIIKMKKNKSLPDTVLEKAAGLAAYFSKSRNQSLATVIYTQRKFVRKIKGADKGKVTVMNEKSVLVKPEVP